MLDGQIDYSQSTLDQLLDAVQRIDRERYPINYARLRAALETHGHRVSDGPEPLFVSAVHLESEQAPPVFTTSIRLSLGRGILSWVEPPRNDFRLIGRGEIHVGSLLVKLIARRYAFVLGVALEHRFDLQVGHIVNVEQGSNTVRFEYREPGHRPKALSFWLPDVATAEAIAERLPKNRTPNFEPVLPAQVQFDENLQRRAPYAPGTTGLVILNLLIFVATLLGGAEFFSPDGRRHIDWGSNFGPYTTGGDWWRLLSYTALHIGVFHILLNMWALAATGPLIERLLGSGQYLLLYLVAGATGGLASISWQPAVNSVGASGAIFGLYGAALALSIRGRSFVPRSVFAPMRNFILVFVAIALAVGLLSQRIDNAAHLGGLAAGFVLGIALARPLVAGGTTWFRNATSVAAAVGIATFTLIGGYALAERRGATLKGEASYWQTQRWLVHAERSVMARQNVIWEMARQDRLADDDFADAVEARVLPTWREAERRFAAIELEPESKVGPSLDYLRKFVASRRKAYETCARGARIHDEQVLQECVRELQRGDEMVRRQEEGGN